MQHFCDAKHLIMLKELTEMRSCSISIQLKVWYGYYIVHITYWNTMCTINCH